MHAVGAEALREEGLARRHAARRLVLPRLLRKPARMLLRKDWKLPRYAGSKATAILF